MGWMEDIGKALPIEKIYDELASKSVKEISGIANNTIKAARCILAPIDYLASQQDRYQRYLKRINDKVPEAFQVDASPQLTGPIMDELQYQDEESLITEMFLNLLAKAIHKEKMHQAHPAFTKIISHISPDEAVILYHLKTTKYVLEREITRDPANLMEKSSITVHNNFPLNLLLYPQNYRMYLDHLSCLNVVSYYHDGTSKVAENSGVDYIIETTQLTDFGTLFIQACMPDNIDLF